MPDSPPYEPTTLGFAILGLLSHGPMTGYQVRRQFETTAIGRYSSSPGSIYPALRRLQEAGLIAHAGSGSPFTLTSAGRERLSAWLLEPVTRDQVERATDILLLRFSLMTDLAPRSAVQAFLAAFRSEAEAIARDLDAFRRGPGGEQPLCGRLAIDCGIATFRAYVRWAKAALEAVNAARPDEDKSNIGDSEGR